MWEAEPAFAAHLVNDRIVPMVAALMGADTVRVWHDQMQLKPPFIGGPTIWHQDFPYWPVISPPNLVSAWVALEDADEANGCMSMARRSHAWGAYRGGTIGDTENYAPDYDPTFLPRGETVETVACPVKAGSVVFHHCLTWHGAPPNRTERPRPAIAVHYMPGDTRYTPHGKAHLVEKHIAVAPRRDAHRRTLSHRFPKRTNATHPCASLTGKRATHKETEMQPPQNDFPYRQKTFALHDTEGMTNALHEDGFALIPGVLSNDECKALRDAIDRLRPFGFDQLGKTDHFKCVFNRDRVFLDKIDQPGVIELAESAMGKQCHVIGETAWRSHPGHDGWSPHTDRVFVEMPEVWASDPQFRLPIYLCTAHFYLNDIDEEMAPTWVIPGSHKSGRTLHGGRDSSPEWKRQENGASVMPRGRRSLFPFRSLAHRKQEYNRGSHALPASGTLLAPLDRATIFAVSFVSV